MSGLQAGNQSKDDGNVCFKLGEYINAIVYYEMAIEYVTGSVDISSTSFDSIFLQAVCYSNILTTYLKLRLYVPAEISMTKGLQIIRDYQSWGFQSRKMMH